MVAYSRFRCPSDALSLSRLLKQTKNALGMGFVLALGIHFSFTQLGGPSSEAEVAKPLTTRFVKRQPRLTKPLEMKKRPQPKRRRIQRKMISVKARVDRQRASKILQPARIIQGLAKPQVAVGRTMAFGAVILEPQAMAEAVQGRMKDRKTVDMSLEMMDISALDTGQYHAMVIQDPTDKRGIRGYFHLYRAYSVTMRSGAHGARWQDDVRIDHGVNRLVRALNEWTMIQSDIAGAITFDDAEMLKTPWVFASSYYGFKITDSEARALGCYLMAGGFFFADAYRPEAPLDRSFRDMYRAALASQGKLFARDWLFEPLPNAHPMYHCFFDFDKAPVGYGISAEIRDLPRHIEGVTIDGRLLALMSNQGYTRTWSDYGPDGFAVITKSYPEHLGYDNTRQLQLGVNTIIFALTQEGSITNRVMDVVGH